MSEPIACVTVRMGEAEFHKLIMDEYGYMAVEGMAVVAAQARGLGWSVSFAGQDWAGIKRGSEIEANQIWGNCNFRRPFVAVWRE